MLEVTYPRPGGTAALHSLTLEVLVLFFRIPAQVEEPAVDRVRQVARGIEETFTNAGLWTPRRRGQSVAGVVFTGGCGDVSQFYRHFRAQYGEPPKNCYMNGRGT